MLPSKTTTTPSLWDKHKYRTRCALHEAALELFAERGYEATTIDMIVERAEVSARTFFRYFPTKDSVYLVSEREWMESFTETYTAQPDSMSAFESMRATLIELAPGVPRHIVVLHDRAVASSPTLRGLAQAQLHEDTQIIAANVATRRGLRHPDDMSVLTAEVGVLAYRRALDAWLIRPAGTDLGQFVADQFNLLTRLYAEEQISQRKERGIGSLGVAASRRSKHRERAS